MSGEVGTMTIVIEIPADRPITGSGEPDRRVTFVMNNDDHLDDDMVTYTEVNPVTRETIAEVDFCATGELRVGMSEWIKAAVPTEGQQRVYQGDLVVRASAAAGHVLQTMFTRLPGLSAPMVATMQAIDAAQNGGN